MKNSKILTSMALIAALNALSIILRPAFSEVYQYVDAHGQVHFSDSPKSHSPVTVYQINGYQTNGYQANGYKVDEGDSSDIKTVDPKELEKIAKRLKKQRIQRESKRRAVAKQISKKHKIMKKAAAAKKEKERACQLARNNETAAFRKRAQGKNLKQMESALSNYEKKQQQRKKKCR